MKGSEWRVPCSGRSRYSHRDAQSLITNRGRRLQAELRPASGVLQHQNALAT